MLRLRDMRGETIKFLAHIGLGCDHNRFLVQPIGIETLGLGKQCRDLLGKPRAYRFGTTAWARSARPASAAISEPGGQNAAKRGALVAAHLAECAERGGETFDHRCLGAAPVLLALLGIADFDHALECEQAVE